MSSKRASVDLPCTGRLNQMCGDMQSLETYQESYLDTVSFLVKILRDRLETVIDQTLCSERERRAVHAGLQGDV